MWIQAVDYLRILEGGNFVHFVAMARVPGDNVSLVTTSEFRFKVCCNLSPVLIFKGSSACNITIIILIVMGSQKRGNFVHFPKFQL